eukprot:395637-Pleurochrysis_carterae.AAC.3
MISILVYVVYVESKEGTERRNTARDENSETTTNAGKYCEGMSVNSGVNSSTIQSGRARTTRNKEWRFDATKTATCV